MERRVTGGFPSSRWTKGRRSHFRKHERKRLERRRTAKDKRKQFTTKSRTLQNYKTVDTHQRHLESISETLKSKARE
jgi:hypothetical protein